MKNLKEIVNNLPDQLKEPVQVENKEKLTKNPKSLVVCGMGGSGIIGDIIHALFPKVPVQVHKSYGLPKAHRTNCLFLIVSYSGNTEETISAFDQAIGENKHIAVVSGGGKLLEKATKEKVPFVKVPHAEEIPARFSVGPCAKAALSILEEVDIIDSAENMISGLDKDVLYGLEEEARKIAENLKDSTALIYSSEELFGFAEIWKIVLNESAKTPAFVNMIPEALHSEIESIKNIKNPYIIFLDDPQQDERVGNKFKIFKKIAEKHNWGNEKIDLSSKNMIVNLVRSTVLALLTGLELAEIKNTDPVETPLINEVKRGL